MKSVFDILKYFKNYDKLDYPLTFYITHDSLIENPNYDEKFLENINKKASAYIPLPSFIQIDNKVYDLFWKQYICTYDLDNNSYKNTNYIDIELDNKILNGNTSKFIYKITLQGSLNKEYWLPSNYIDKY
tara:strand:- start:80 stop:469 length:390 start_codon:yes stop_codon:yes gene_type:complete